MSHHSSLDNYVLNKIPDNVDDKIILDLGSGYGIWNLLIHLKKEGLANSIGLDVFLPYLKKLKSLNLYNNLICADVRHLPFRDNKIFDITIASEILEHMDKKEGLQALNYIEKISNELIITTPDGPLKTKGYDKNRHQIHKSSWIIDDFLNKEFNTQVIYSVRLNRILRVVDKILHKIFKTPLKEKKQIIAWK